MGGGRAADTAVAKFIVPDWGDIVDLLGFRTSPTAYVAWRAGTTILCQIWLYPPSQGLWFWRQISNWFSVCALCAMIQLRLRTCGVYIERGLVKTDSELPLLCIFLKELFQTQCFDFRIVFYELCFLCCKPNNIILFRWQRLKRNFWAGKKDLSKLLQGEASIQVRRCCYITADFATAASQNEHST